jgi:hypothetical protein
MTRARLDAAHARIDRGLRPALAEFDLLRGLAGLGALYLYRHPDHELARAVLSYLVRITEPLPTPTDGLPGWWTDHGPTDQPCPDFPGGHGNFGMAHGISGVLAALACGLRRGVIVPGHDAAIGRICAWLDSWQQDHPAGPWWPRTVAVDEARSGRIQQPGPGQPSWCYGTPGIAAAMHRAALATGGTARQRLAEAALVGCLTDPAQLHQLTGSGLCHGLAGLLQVTWRMARDARIPDIPAALPLLTARLLQQHRACPENSTLLEGRTGDALALHTAATDTEPRTRWDACLLLA